jgi:hypothetical protein
MYTDPTGHWESSAERAYAQQHWDSDDFERADELSRLWIIKNNEIKEYYTVGSYQYAESVSVRNGYTDELNNIRGKYIVGPSLPTTKDTLIPISAVGAMVNPPIENPKARFRSGCSQI